MTKTAKYIITNIFVNADRNTSFSNDELLDMVLDNNVDITYKTVQNVTAGLKLHGGLSSSRDPFTGFMLYTRTSKAKVVAASEFIF